MEAAFAGLLLSCVYNIMARRICVNRFWLAGGKAIILIGFPFYTCIVGVNPQPWMPINTQTKECIASIRSAWVAPIPPNIPLKSWTEILQKSVQSWYIPFALQVSYDIRVSKIVHVQQFHQPRLVIRTFHRQGRCSRGGHLCNEHSEEKYSCSYK